METVTITYRTMSPSTAPSSGAERGTGSDRNRSKMPFAMSVLRLTPIAMQPVAMVCARMPGSRNCRYSSVDPATAPPKMYTKMTRNSTG
nr:hypothetical protein GCM10020092_102570 [Actinoplanes digitatis]